MAGVAEPEGGEHMATSAVEEEQEDGAHTNSVDENCTLLERTDLETNPNTITDLIKTKLWLENQLTELRTELYAESADDINSQADSQEEKDPEILENKVSQLQSELEDVCAVSAVQSIMLSRIQDSEALYYNLFTNSGDAEEGDGDKLGSHTKHEDRKKLLASLCVKQAVMTREILSIVKENKELLSKLNGLKSANLDLKQSIQSLMNSLVNVKDQKKNVIANTDDDFLTAKESLISTEQKVEMVRHLLQSLIFGSGINWAEDARLLKLVLDLGQPVEEHLFQAL